MNIPNHAVRAHEESQRRAIMRWAEVIAAEPHDVEIVVPPEFNRQQALDALEVAVCRKYQFIGIVQLGQGRDAADARFADASLALIVALGVAIGLAALGGLVWCLV